jgi:hypothetical protein
MIDGFVLVFGLGPTKIQREREREREAGLIIDKRERLIINKIYIYI